MRRYMKEVFDDVVMGTGTVYTSAEFNNLLGSTDTLSLQVIADHTTASTRLTLQLEHSGDGRVWGNIESTPEIEDESIPENATTSFVVGSGQLQLGFVRCRISLTTTSSNPAAHIKIHATGRDPASA